MTANLLDPAHGPLIRTERISSFRAPRALSTALAAATIVGASATFFVDGVLRGTPVMNGSARGTALILLILAVPALVFGAVKGPNGSAPAVLAWLGALGYIAYNSLLLLFATPFNRMFLVYEAMLGLSLATAAVLLARLDPRAVADRIRHAPTRLLAIFMWATVALNALGWLSDAIPAVIAGRDLASMAGAGLTTNPIYVFDLALWLPLAAVTALWLWQRRPIGYVTAGAVLVMWLIESIGVATDQWFGSRADPNSTIATTAGVYLFAAMTVVNAIAVALLLRRAAPRSPHSVVVPLTLLQLFVGGMAIYAGVAILVGDWAMDQAWLRHTPFPDWRLPGLALLLLPGVGELLAASAVLARWRFARLLGLTSGWGLVAWVGTQLAWMRVFHPVMQPFIVVVGLAIAMLAYRLPRVPLATDQRRHLRSRPGGRRFARHPAH